jgi:hypothetical protein
MDIKIAAKMVPLRQAPHRSAEIVARLEKNFIVTVVEEVALDDAVWFRLNSGWMCTMDSNGELCYVSSSAAEAEKFWAVETETRRRVAKAICQVKSSQSHSLVISPFSLCVVCFLSSSCL